MAGGGRQSSQPRAEPSALRRARPSGEKGAKTDSRGGLGILVNHAAEAIATLDAEVAVGSEQRRAPAIRGRELQGSVRPMPVVVLHELGEDALQVSLVQGLKEG